ncbi:MAG: 4-hydroxy-tetrahydrodipicolinate synthase [Muribaculaceae bacterium]|nr:4-hydroxy-tetrahydrodipicolinate synthase [Muribaculaceae bacterium]MDE5968588.1 4-hydroxy-tetrahydrodipicolinate synthase [Muribaculaceae bacterium]
MSRINLKGMGVALVTPFKADKSIDFESLSRLLEYQIQNSVDYLVVLGTTAETPALSPEERVLVRDFVVERVAGRVPLVLGMGGNSTMALVNEIKSTDLTPYSAILSVVPYYNKPSQEGIYQHYAEIAKASPVPVVLYNVPGRTGVNMTPETTLRLARDFDNIVGIKEASGNISQMDEIIKKKPEEFMVISGDDGITYPLLTLGAVGVISVIGNAFPKEFSRMVRMTLEGDYERGLEIHHRFTELFKLLFVDGNPAGVKCLLHAMGFIENELRLPLVPTRISTHDEISRVLRELY